MAVAAKKDAAIDKAALSTMVIYLSKIPQEYKTTEI